MLSYLLITDCYLMILFPDDNIRNRAKIVYQGEIIMINDILPHPVLVFDKETGLSTEIIVNENENENEKGFMPMVIQWKDTYSKKLNKTLLVKENEYINIFNIINDKRQHLITTFDYTFPNQNNTVDDITSIISIREKEKNEENEFYTEQDLMDLYQQMIEIYSEDYKEKCEEYVEKLQTLVRSINKDNNNNHYTKEG